MGGDKKGDGVNFTDFFSTGPQWTRLTFIWLPDYFPVSSKKSDPVASTARV